MSIDVAGGLAIKKGRGQFDTHSITPKNSHAFSSRPKIMRIVTGSVSSNLFSVTIVSMSLASFAVSSAIFALFLGERLS